MSVLLTQKVINYSVVYSTSFIRLFTYFPYKISHYFDKISPHPSRRLLIDFCDRIQKTAGRIWILVVRRGYKRHFMSIISLSVLLVFGKSFDYHNYLQTIQTITIGVLALVKKSLCFIDEKIVLRQNYYNENNQECLSYYLSSLYQILDLDRLTSTTKRFLFYVRGDFRVKDVYH